MCKPSFLIFVLWGPVMQVGDPVMVVESDKADMDVESFEEGYLAAVLTEEGASAKVGAAVALIVERWVLVLVLVVSVGVAVRAIWFGSRWGALNSRLTSVLPGRKQQNDFERGVP